MVFADRKGFENESCWKETLENHLIKPARYIMENPKDTIKTRLRSIEIPASCPVYELMRKLVYHVKLLVNIQFIEIQTPDRIHEFNNTHKIYGAKIKCKHISWELIS